jgi:hypothetical protein
VKFLLDHDVPDGVAFSLEAQRRDERGAAELQLHKKRRQETEKFFCP